MLRIRTIAAIAITATATFAAAPRLLQEMEMPKPTEHHAMLQKGVGEWEGTVTMFIPGMPETSYPATETVRANGPFWTVSNFKSEFMGQAYEGHGCHGYDPEKGKFTSTWIDSMSSYLSVMEGDYDAETNTMTSKWEAPDMTGAMAPHRSELVMEENAYEMTFWTRGEKIMHIAMKRKM